MSKWIEKRTRPVLPLYLAALTWPVASLILPPYRLVNLVIIAALSTVVYLPASAPRGCSGWNSPTPPAARTPMPC